MQVKIKLPSAMREKFGEQRLLELDANDIHSFLKAVESQDWGSQLVEGGRIRSPYALVIDDQLILLKENPQLNVHENSEIRFLLFLTGG